MGNGLHVLDYLVVGVFFALMVSVGIYYGHRQKSSDQFFGGDKSIPWWLAGISFYMGSFSALAFVMYSALAYKYGWVPVTLSWLNVPVLILITWFLAVRWRRAARTSPLEFIERRFSNKMRQGLMWLCLPMRLLDAAFKLLAIGTVVGVGMGFPLATAIAVSGLVIIVYTFLGGLKAALVCDFIQFFVLFVVVLALPFFCIGPVGGFSKFVENAPAGFFDFVSGKYTWLYIAVFFFAQLIDLSTSWSMVQRFYATRSEKDAKKVGWLVTVLMFVGPPLFFFPAMAAREFMPGIADADMNGVYAIVCKKVLPIGMMGMVIAAMFSATMSTLAGFYNAMASVVTNDFYLRMVNPKASPRRAVAIGRIATVAIGILVIGCTFLMQYAQGANDLFDVTNQMFGVFAPPIALPMIAGLLVRRVSKGAGLVGLLLGIAAGMVAFVSGVWIEGVREMIPMNAITATATLTGLFVGSWLYPDDVSAKTDLDGFFRQLDTPS